MATGLREVMYPRALVYDLLFWEFESCQFSTFGPITKDKKEYCVVESFPINGNGFHFFKAGDRCAFYINMCLSILHSVISTVIKLYL